MVLSFQIWSGTTFGRQAKYVMDERLVTELEKLLCRKTWVPADPSAWVVIRYGASTGRRLNNAQGETVVEIWRRFVYLGRGSNQPAATAMRQ